MNLEEMFRAAELVIYNNTGYSQGDDPDSGRWSGYDRNTDKIRGGHALDCSSFAGLIARRGGAPINLWELFYTVNMVQRLVATGKMYAIKTSNATFRKQIQPGDILVGPGHTVFIYRDGRFAEASLDENLGIIGGQPGKQEPWETRFIEPYELKRGWEWIVRPIPVAPEPIPPILPKEDKLTVIRYHREDATSHNTTGGRTLAPGKHFWLNTEPNALDKYGTNVVGGVGEYVLVAHIYATGEPGDVIEVLYQWQNDNPGYKPKSNHYLTEIEIPSSGRVRAHIPALRGAVLGDRVYLRARGADKNKGNIQVTILDSDATLIK